MEPDLVDKLNAFARQGKGGTRRLNLPYADGWTCVLCGLGDATCLGASCLGKVPLDVPHVSDDGPNRVERSPCVVISSLCNVEFTGSEKNKKRGKRY